MYRAGPEAPVAYPDLADSLRLASDRICGVWGAAVRRELPGADETTFARVRDEVLRTLSALADAVGGGTKAPDSVVATESNATAGESVPEGYRIDEAVTELNLLRRTVLEELPLQLGRSFLDNEVVVVNEHLDSMVRQMVVAYAQHQARELAEAREGQSKYLSFLSHDLRGGLNGIFLMVEVLRREFAGHADLAESIDDLEIMRRSILDTVATMDRFLFAERFRKGKVKARPTPFSLKTLLVEIGSRFAYAAREQGIELKVDIAERADIVNDRELLALVLQCLVANALKNTTGGTVQLSARPRESGSGWRVEVGDTGSGIEPDLLGKIRDCLVNPIPGQMPTPGLGLSLVSQAARLIGAKLGADSTVGEGSRFWVEFTQTPHPRSDAASGP